MIISLDALRYLSDHLDTYADDRPGWLVAMPYATETPTHYYRLLWELAKQKKPAVVIEIGIDKAGSTMSLAAGNPGGKVTSIDIDQGSCQNARSIAELRGLKNLTVVCDDSLRQVRSFDPELQIDLLFVDGAHDFSHCYQEYELYRPFMREGGIILFDDIHQGSEMEAAWAAIVDPKVELPRAHQSGFGACKVDHRISVPPFASLKR